MLPVQEAAPWQTSAKKEEIKQAKPNWHFWNAPCSRFAPSDVIDHNSAMSISMHGSVTQLHALRPHTEAYLISPAGYYSVFITLPRDLFFELAESSGMPDLEEPLQLTNTVTIEPGRLQELRALLHQLLTLPSLRERLLGELLPLLQEALVNGLERRRGQRPPSAPRIDLVKQVDRWLCQEVHSSRRTLIRGFREHLGLGPMQFLKLHRLHAVRHALLCSDPQLNQVAGVAGQWGFHSAGHFAHDYQELFGELPSDTLRRDRSRVSRPAPS